MVFLHASQIFHQIDKMFTLNVKEEENICFNNAGARYCTGFPWRCNKFPQTWCLYKLIPLWFWRPEVWDQFYFAKVKMSQDYVPSGDSRREFLSLPFPAAKGHLAVGPFLCLQSSSVQSLPMYHDLFPDSVPHTPPYKDPCNYTGPPRSSTIISKYFIAFAKFLLLF